ncbi:amino acid adenylation domain-containing protein, partial [Mesobacillus zeae]
MERFESHAASHPDKIALIYENQTMTYRELNEEANQLARYFIDHGVKKESVVGIKMNRSIDMMVVIFGILKSGASYLPIGIDTPQARIDYMLLDSECKLLITDQANEMASSHESADFQCILYGHIRDFLQDYEKTNHKIEDIRKSKAYIIYTSGSTGQPKGVVVEHDALTERMNWFHVKYMREETSRILLKTAITFDVSITELFGWIGCQGQLVVLPEGEEKNSAKIRETVIRYNVTDLNFTPSAFKVMGNELQNVASIQRIYLAGEALTKDVVQEAFRINSTLEVFNLYGPTETVIYATGTKIEKESPSITIGKPIDNVSVYILDSNQQLCPVGIIGELYISGNSLARGYLNNPELTAERFIENPYAANQRMYKTGDLVRWTHDGHIEYLGRIDHQVKIRGY